MASGRILNNPELGSDPHYTFIQEVCDTVADLKMNNDEFRYKEVLNFVRLFFLGPQGPGSKGEPVKGLDKVVCQVQLLGQFQFCCWVF